MSVERIQQVRPFPNFKLHELPEAEREDAVSIRNNIGDMHNRASSFWAGQMLFQNCAEHRVFEPAKSEIYHRWQLCAARDCVMSIYHFGRIIEGIDKSLSACPQLRAKIDCKAKQKARKWFEKQFPSYITLRNAIAHSAERSNTAKDMKRHGTTKSDWVKIDANHSIRIHANLQLANDNFYGTTFSSMWDGNLIQCDISQQSGLHLDQLVEAFWLSFDAIIDPNPKLPPQITVSEHSHCDDEIKHPAG